MVSNRAISFSNNFCGQAQAIKHKAGTNTKHEARNLRSYWAMQRKAALFCAGQPRNIAHF
jgi:hypothetical protein